MIWTLHEQSYFSLKQPLNYVPKDVEHGTIDVHVNIHRHLLLKGSKGFLEALQVNASGCKTIIGLPSLAGSLPCFETAAGFITHCVFFSIGRLSVKKKTLTTAVFLHFPFTNGFLGYRPPNGSTCGDFCWTCPKLLLKTAS